MLKIYTDRSWSRPHNLEFFMKKGLSYWPKAKIFSFEFFSKMHKKQAWHKMSV